MKVHTLLQIVRLVASYLHERRKLVNWGDKRALPRLINGGSGQGAIWSALLFLITVDDLVRRLRVAIAKAEPDAAQRSVTFSFVDDTALAVDFDRRLFPTDSSGRKIFKDDGRIHKYLEIIKDYTKESGMKLNTSKTKVLTFDSSQPRTIFDPRTFDFIHKPGPDEKEILVEKLKLLGVTLDQDLTLNALAKDRRRAGLFATYGLQQLQAQGVTGIHLKSAYVGYVRPITEYGLLSASTLLNKSQWAMIEAVQRRALKVVLGFPPLAYGPEIPQYNQRLQELSLLSLEDRTAKKFCHFSLNNEFLDRFSQYLPRRIQHGPTTRNFNHYFTPIPRTERFKNSPFSLWPASSTLYLQPQHSDCQ